MVQFRTVTIAFMALAIGPGLFGCKPIAPDAAADSRQALQVEPSQASVPVEPLVTLESGSPEGLTLTRDEGCKRAVEILATCANETSCSTEMTMFLPSAARSQYVLLTKQSWFVQQQFDRYCETVCKAESSAVDNATFEKDVCIAAALSEGAAPSSAIALVVGGLDMPKDGVPLSQVINKLGQPTRVSDSQYTCDSAFEEEGIKEYVYPNATFETDGSTAVLRMMKMGDGNEVTFPGVASADSYFEADLQKTPGIRAKKLRDHTYRASTAPGGDLETAYDFIFVGDKLASIEYWIGC